jgi:hypothetical protein
MSYFLGSSNGLSVVRPPPPQALPSAAVHPFGDETGTFLSGLNDSGSNLSYRNANSFAVGTTHDARFSLGFNSDTQNQNGDPMKYCLKADHLYFWILCPSISEVEGRRHRLDNVRLPGLYRVTPSWLTAQLRIPVSEHFVYADEDLTLEFVTSTPSENGL